MWGLDPSLLGENLYDCDISSVCGLQPWGVDTDYTKCLRFPPISFWFFVIVFSCGKIFSSCLQVIHMDSCSVNSYNFGVSIGEGELRVFLLCHVGQLSK